MDLESYLRSINVSEADIKRLPDEKIDCNVISLMSDEELSWFLKSTGDRVLLRNFVKTHVTSVQRKEHLINSIRERLAAIRSKRLGEGPSDRKRKKKTVSSEGPNTKSIRQLYMGWKHKEGCRVTQVIEKKGGGTKLLSMPKDYKKTGIIELAKKIYFTNGKSSKGDENQFSFELIDTSNKLLPSDKSVLQILEEHSPKIPRIYLQTERSKMCANNGNEQVENEQVENEQIENEQVENDQFENEQVEKETADSLSTCMELSNGNQGVTLLYVDACVSKYSGETVISFKDKKQIFDQICRLQGPPDIDYSNFDPVDFNYPVGRIEVDGISMLDINAQFLHQEKGPNLSVNQPVASNLSADDSCQLSETLLPIVARKDIKFSEKILGAGSQGIVREDSWLGTEVAIKSFKTGKLTEMELREVKLLARIRHPHIIQIMGISLEQRQTHLIFELVKGDNLGDILFDEEKRKRYQLNNEKKTKLLLQVCQGISYLHKQKNPIIHQDIKPDNILVSKNLTIKLCDLGLAKFKTMATQFRTVVGSLKGTVAYMAPEILLSKATATTSSDIWSLGCTVLETYTEEAVWPDLGEDFTKTLKNKMENCEIPNIVGLPSHYQPIVQRCFIYNTTERPDVEELMNCFNKKLTDDNTSTKNNDCVISDDVTGLS